MSIKKTTGLDQFEASLSTINKSNHKRSDKIANKEASTDTNTSELNTSTSEYKHVEKKASFLGELATVFTNPWNAVEKLGHHLLEPRLEQESPSKILGGAFRLMADITSLKSNSDKKVDEKN